MPYHLFTNPKTYVQIDAGNKQNMPDLLCALNPSKSYQVLYHGEENHESAYTQLYLSEPTRKEKVLVRQPTDQIKVSRKKIANLLTDLQASKLFLKKTSDCNS